MYRESKSKLLAEKREPTFTLELPPGEKAAADSASAVVVDSRKRARSESVSSSGKTIIALMCDII